ncbi:hypothetical protein [Microseira wollei]|uniref:hypothetical protein n=1 Tax=Microseira wollei TaxID=467598 RepID=UPI001CFCFFE4|nr:hypothetical protein [Microseira wollei]
MLPHPLCPPSPPIPFAPPTPPTPPTFISTDIAQQAQQIVDEYSVEQITEYLDATHRAQQAAVRTGTSVLLATNPKTRRDVQE